jgi:hypothetical protein
MVDSADKRTYRGSKIMLNTSDGTLLSPLISLNGFSTQIIDDGQASGQWFKALYVGLPARTPKASRTGNVVLIIVSYDGKSGLKFTLNDDLNIYSGKCM